MKARLTVKEREERLSSAESIIKPNPVNLYVYWSTSNPFPIKVDEDRIARRYAWHEVEEAWHDRAADEAERTYDRRKYADFKAVVICDWLCDPLTIHQKFKADLEAGTFTASEYQCELAEAAAWSERNGLPAPVNLLGAPRDKV